jgi:hypothetical protein
MYSIPKQGYNIFTANYLYSIFSPLTLFQYYTNLNFSLNKVYSSPFRADTIPSFSIFKSNIGTYLFKDLATGDCGDAIKLVNIYIYSNTPRSVTIFNILKDLLWSKKKFEPQNQIQIKPKAKLGIQRGNFTEIDLKYWKQFNITLNILQKYNAYKTNLVFVGDKVCWGYSKTNPIYTYVINGNYKIYRPYSTNKASKWLGNTTLNDIGGYKQLPPTGELLIITKSLKDVMVLDSLGYNAITPNSETSLIPNVIIEELKQRFTTLIVFYDNDIPGKKASAKMCETYNLHSFDLPETTNTKDIAEFMQKYGYDTTRNLLGDIMFANSNTKPTRNTEIS